MKKGLLVFGAMCLIMAFSNNAFSAPCRTLYCQGFEPMESTMSSSICGTSTDLCYQSATGSGTRFAISNCTSCFSGQLKSVTLTSQAHGCTITVNQCVDEPACDGTCDDCNSTSWTSVTDGYESRITATCNTDTCKCSKIEEYRCASNWYKSGFFVSCVLRPTGMACLGCSACPSPGKSSAGAASDITDCCIPTSATATDSIGTYRYSRACCYTE